MWRGQLAGEWADGSSGTVCVDSVPTREGQMEWAHTATAHRAQAFVGFRGLKARHLLSGNVGLCGRKEADGQGEMNQKQAVCLRMLTLQVMYAQGWLEMMGWRWHCSELWEVWSQGPNWGQFYLPWNH